MTNITISYQYNRFTMETLCMSATGPLMTLDVDNGLALDDWRASGLGACVATVFERRVLGEYPHPEKASKLETPKACGRGQKWCRSTVQRVEGGLVTKTKILVKVVILTDNSTPEEVNRSGALLVKPTTATPSAR